MTNQPTKPNDRKGSMKDQMTIIKTPEQIARKYKRVYKTMQALNNPKNFGGRELTSQEWIALERAHAEWQMLAWLTGRFTPNEDSQ